MNQHKIHSDIITLQSAIKDQELVVLTNGCFDLLHIGHVDYLMKARAEGSCLIVGINTDESVSKLKGANRPINVLKDRIGMLSALECVDHIIAFKEDTPYQLISELQPDILIKASDYKVEDIVGYDIVTAKGGRVKTIDILHHISSTQLISKIKAI